MEAYELRPVTVDEDTLGRMAALLRTAFPGAAHYTEDVLRWQYKENPAGAAVGFNAWLGEELAGHYVALPHKALVNGVSEAGLLSLNTATHPAHQGKGLFTRLAKATYTHAAEAGFGFVVGVANANSTHGFTKKLGFHLVSPLRAMIGVGPLPRERAADVRFAREWDPATLAWRLRHPAYSYTMKQERGQALVLSRRTQLGARYVLGRRGLAMTEGAVPRERGNVLRKVWIGLDPGMRWAGSAFVNIPMRLRPSPLNLIFKDLTDQGRTLNPAHVRFDTMDFDIL